MDARTAAGELLDVAGRVIERRTLRGGGATPVTVRLGSSSPLAPGVYLLSLSDGQSSITRRAALIR